MQKLVIMLFAFTLLGGCGGSPSSSNEGALSEEAELQAADSIVTELQKTQEDISSTTSETLEEVDSLLENF